VTTWRETTWGEICTLSYGKALKGYQERTEGYPVFGTNGRIGFWETALQEEAGVIVGRKGAYRGVHYSPGPFFVIDTAYALRPSSEVDARWAYYRLLYADINSMDSGSAIPSTSRDEFYAMPVWLPVLAEQRQVASILGALDDKIENNHKTAATLEEMARALYRSWFVDFDPVHAKAAGEKPAFMDEQTAALFPDRFGDDGLPEGWEMEPLSNQVEIVSGGTPKTGVAEFWGGEIPWYSVVDAPDPGLAFVVDTEKHLTRTGFENCSAKMIRKGTTIISARGTVGKLAMASRDMAFNQSCYGLLGTKSFSDEFVFYSAQHAITKLQSMSHGSVFSTITRKTFGGIELTKVPEKVLRAFSEKAGLMLEKNLACQRENLVLASLRNTLLPKLISGEIRVGEAREQVEEVT